MGILYLVPTPIGNLQDFTSRSIEVLRTVDAIACEDTRKTGFLMKHLSEAVPDFSNKPLMISYYEQTELQKIPGILNLLFNDKNVALVSDAGMPTISDPGFRLVRECIRQRIHVVALPGASAVTTALAVSGLPTDKFLFLGYPPHKPGHRENLYKNILETQKLLSSTIIFFEAPHKLVRTLEEMKTIFGDIPLVICRELTKVHEEIRRETISESLAHFKKTPPKGEFVILFHMQYYEIGEHAD